MSVVERSFTLIQNAFTVLISYFCSGFPGYLNLLLHLICPGSIKTCLRTVSEYITIKTGTITSRKREGNHRYVQLSKHSYSGTCLKRSPLGQISVAASERWLQYAKHRGCGL